MRLKWWDLSVKGYYRLLVKEKMLLISTFAFFMKVLKCCLQIPLPDDKISTLSKLKANVDNNFSLAQLVQFFSDRVGNFVGKGENAGFQHFLLFPQCFRKAFFSVM